MKEMLLARRQARKTNHVLHLLLSILTAGFWIPVWILVALRNSVEIWKIDRQIMKEE